MTRIIVSYDKDLCSYVELSGHAGYADFGHDIVCSGITTVTYTSINLIDRLEHGCFKLKVDEKTGYLRMDLNYQNMSKERIHLINEIISNMIDMYNEIRRDYPKYLKIEIIGGCHD